MIVDRVYAGNNVRRGARPKTEEEKSSTMSEYKRKREDNETRLEADREDGMPPGTGKMKKQRKASKAAGQYVAGCSCTNISASAPS